MTVRLLGKFRDYRKTFQRDTRGTSAIEFAIIAPLLIGIVVAIGDVTNISYGASNMQSAVRAGIQYALKGGTDAPTAQSQADSAWTMKPSGATIAASKACKCAGLSVDCALPCPDLTSPQMFMTVTATASFGGNYIRISKTATETVRVR